MTSLDESVRVELRRRLPSKLSPSRASDFQQCPKLFYYKSMLKLPSPSTVATTTGTLAHFAFEKIFDHPREERVPEVAVPYVRQHWAEIVDKPDYAPLAAEIGPDGVESMLVSAERHVVNWFSVERPHNFDPVERELYVSARVGGVDVHGYIDRLDRVGDPGRYIISDYKTGKLPNDRFVEKTFFGMNVYSLVLEQMRGITATDLRLVFTLNGSRDDVRRQPVTRGSIKSTEAKVSAIWKAIVKSADKGCFEPSESVLCGWCQFQSICPAKNPSMDGVPVLDRDGNPAPA
jgi:putative RecB family exonuclease